MTFHPRIDYATLHRSARQLEHEGEPFIAMELLEGETLRDRIARKRLKVDEMLELGIQIADALDAAHRAKIVHRDIKPANIMIRSTSDFVIADFGLAKMVQQNISLTSTGEVLALVAEGGAEDIDRAAFWDFWDFIEKSYGPSYLTKFRDQKPIS